MKIRYDLHIHSGLSPCADKDMTPVNIVGLAKLEGIDMVAVSDHNSFLNVEVALKAGESYGVTVVPAMELQTSEDIHILCLFETLDGLKAFHEELSFMKVKNRAEIFGTQEIYDEEDNVTGVFEDLLLVSASISEEDVPALAQKHGGVAVPAHIDREENGMMQILGTIGDGYGAVELSSTASAAQIERYQKRYKVLVNSDAHTLDQIEGKGVLELPDCTAAALIQHLR